ncbi:phosphomannomutase [Thioclava sp. F1Mire-8]|uniref:phosphomannomutase n=1 Tax=Thioclava sp. F1Mire-8 TaxID=1973006 RepID=UPI000B53EE22|nr:phosphomannomutase [Thioclava sp. F1Mire-8]OWY03500.1 phosphomannomutase [Thioclava sp. F1Mire-8]
MAPKFGTSGLRGLVTELTDALVTDYTRAFLSACPQGGAVHVGWDLRPSSPAIAETVIAAIRDAGLTAIREGALPTPALALASMGAGNAAIMVTGSHIPADRNGLKFYVPHGEIAKEDEAAILDRLGQDHPVTEKCGSEIPGADTAAHYIARYVDAFGSEALEGLRIGVYQHSSVARDILVTAIEAMGATAVPLARSDEFIPVDTEAIAPETRETLQGWCTEQRLDAVISTDGDADRPMLTDETGTLIPGDVLGALTARLLGAKILCTPVSANTMVDAMPEFDSIHRTKIGSPFVIAAMGAALAADPAAKVVGYEPNGGFLLGFTATGPVGQIAPLATRDCLLPIVAPLVAAKKAGTALSGLVAQLPARFTAADRVAEVSTDRSRAFIDRLADDPVARTEFFSDFDPAERIDQTDGLRLTFPSGEIVHLRPSGNAPECRCYAEAATPERAESLVASYLAALRTELT